MNGSMNEWISQSVKKCTYKLVNQSVLIQQLPKNQTGYLTFEICDCLSSKQEREKKKEQDSCHRSDYIQINLTQKTRLCC